MFLKICLILAIIFMPKWWYVGVRCAGGSSKKLIKIAKKYDTFLTSSYWVSLMSHTSSENPQSAFRFNIFQGQLGLSEVKLGSNRHGWSKYIKYTYVSSQNFVQGCKIGLKTGFVIRKLRCPSGKQIVLFAKLRIAILRFLRKLRFFPR